MIVSGLPSGVPADIVVHGPHGYVKRLRSSALLASLKPGTYRLQLSKVRFSRPYKSVPAGSVAFPSRRELSATVRRGATSLAAVSYGTVRSARVLVVRLHPISITGPPTMPQAILVSRRAGTGIRRGAILAQSPTASLPGGLFDRVTAVRRVRRGVRLSLHAALLSEAFPAMDVQVTVPLNFGPPGSASSARAADFLSKVDLSFSAPLIPGRLESSCGAPPVGWSLVPFGSLQPTLNANIHRGFLGLPYGELSVTLAGNVGFDATIPSAVHCGLTVDGPHGWTVIPIADVPVPVEAALNLNITLALDSPVQAHASAGATLTTGVDLHGVYGTPILNVSHANATGSVKGNAVKLTVGPEVQAGIGSNDVNAHVDGSVFIAGKASANGCEVDLGASGGLGVDLFFLHGAWTPIEPEVPIYTCPKPPSLHITQTGPPLAFPGQEFEYTIDVSNTGGTTAENVVVADTLPGEGSFVSSSPAGSPSSPPPSSQYAIPLGNVPAGGTSTLHVRWHAPTNQTALTSSATASASNTGQAGPASATVSVGTTGNCNPCGAASAGVGLRNRNRGVMTIAGIPPGATVTQAILIWGILYAGEVPTNQITFDGHHIAANLTSSVSGNLCWGDTATVGYAADVTPYVAGDGTFEVTEPPNGEIRVDSNPYGTLPYTDGASLVVFYNGGGADNQVLSDFSYNTNTDPSTGDAITRTFAGVNSIGGPASLTLAGPDGQNNGGKIFTFQGAGEQEVIDPFVGSAPQEGPSFEIGNLWDDEVFDVTSILPAGQQTLTFNNNFTEDCIGVGAAVLQVSQAGAGPAQRITGPTGRSVRRARSRRISRALDKAPGGYGVGPAENGTIRRGGKVSLNSGSTHGHVNPTRTRASAT